MPKDPGPAPRAEMPLWKLAISRVFAGLFDAIKFGCICLIFFAPVIVGVGTKIITQDYLEKTLGVGWGDAVSSLAGIAAGGATLVAQLTLPQIDGIIEGVGVLFAMTVGFVGWIFFMFFFLLTGVRIFREGGNAVLWVLFGFLISEVPFVDIIPSFTVSIWRITAEARAHDKKERDAWQARVDAYQAAQRRSLQERIRAAQAAAMQQQEVDQSFAAEEAANDDELAAANEDEPLPQSRKSPNLVAVPAY